MQGTAWQNHTSFVSFFIPKFPKKATPSKAGLEKNCLNPIQATVKTKYQNSPTKPAINVVNVRLDNKTLTEFLLKLVIKQRLFYQCSGFNMIWGI